MLDFVFDAFVVGVFPFERCKPFLDGLEDYEERGHNEYLENHAYEHAADRAYAEGAVAVCAANDGICDGSFDYNIRTGQITFRLTTSFCGETVLGEELFEYMIFVASATVDKYNDKFYLLAQGGMSLSQFIEFADE